MPTSGGHLIPSSQVVNYGDVAVLQVVPDSGYTVGSVTGCGGSLSELTYTTGVITEDCSIEARFDRIPEPVVASSGGGCFISTVNSGGSYWLIVIGLIGLVAVARGGSE